MKVLWWLTCLTLGTGLVLAAIDVVSSNRVESNIQANVEKRILEHNQALDIGDGYIFEEGKRLDDVIVLIYHNAKLINWNSIQHVPDFSDHEVVTNHFFHAESTGTYLVSVMQRGDYRFYAITVLTLDYDLRNTYVQPFSNAQIFDGSQVEVVTGEGEEVIVDGKSIFGFKVTSEPIFQSSTISIFWCAILLITVLLYLQFRARRKYWIIFLLGIFLVAGWIAPTIEPGLRTIFLLVVALMLGTEALTYTSRSLFRRVLRFADGKNAASLLFVLSFAVAWNVVYLFLLEQTLLAWDWEIDISRSLRIDTGRVVSYIIVLIGSLVLLAVNHVFLRLLAKMRVSFPVLAGVCGVLVIVSFLSPVALVTYAVVITALVYLLIAFFELNQPLTKFSYNTFFYLLIGFALAAFVNTTAIYKFAEETEKLDKRRFAQYLLSPEDKVLESELAQIGEDIQSDPNIRVRFLNPAIPRVQIENRLRSTYLRSFLDEYEVELTMFDAVGITLGGNAVHLQDILSDYGLGPIRQGVYFLESREGFERPKYLSLVPLGVGEKAVGSLLITLTRKKVIPRTVYPALLDFGVAERRQFDFMLFKNAELVFSRGTYSFDFFSKPGKWEKLLQSGGGVETEGYHLLGHAEGDGYVVVISEVYPIRSMLANFSFHFILFLTVLGVYFLLSRILGRGVKLSLSNRIQLYLGASFILPLLVVSVVILNLLNVSYREEIIRNYEKRCIAVADNMYRNLRDFHNNQVNLSAVSQELEDASNLVRADLNLYSATGQLLASSQPGIYNKKLVSKRINPAALHAIEEKPEQTSVFDEQIALLEFRSVYRGVIDQRTGQLLGVISIPFFESKNHLNRQQLEVFGNLVMVFAAIFIASTFLGYFVIRNITFPITTISRALRATNLEADNEPIIYQGEDEIGRLVAEYNGMLRKLEASKAALAQSQKETAWKEIARQVAHEIKNPLTPMRLKIQQILRRMDASDEKSAMLQSLINQIDSLSDIADSFSAFAKMPAPNSEVVNVTRLAKEVCDLYRSKNVNIEFDGQQDLLVLADPKILNRVFNNLLLNGIQATENEPVNIDVSMESEQKKVKIQFTDHGFGIPEEISHKIFTPYFSTKEKGSGIGLAIAKKGIEQAGGSIWFDSKVGEGTTFTILLPKVSD